MGSRPTLTGSGPFLIRPSCHLFLGPTTGPLSRNPTASAQYSSTRLPGFTPCSASSLGQQMAPPKRNMPPAPHAPTTPVRVELCQVPSHASHVRGLPYREDMSKRRYVGQRLRLHSISTGSGVACSRDDTTTNLRQPQTQKLPDHTTIQPITFRYI